MTTETAPLPAPLKRPRGFATFTPEKRRAVAVLGGIAAHAAGMAHEWTTETGRAAGRKGGKAKRAKGVRIFYHAFLTEYYAWTEYGYCVWRNGWHRCPGKRDPDTWMQTFTNDRELTPVEVSEFLAAHPMAKGGAA